MKKILVLTLVLFIFVGCSSNPDTIEGKLSDLGFKNENTDGDITYTLSAKNYQYTIVINEPKPEEGITETYLAFMVSNNVMDSSMFFVSNSTDYPTHFLESIYVCVYDESKETFNEDCTEQGKENLTTGINEIKEYLSKLGVETITELREKWELEH